MIIIIATADCFTKVFIIPFGHLVIAQLNNPTSSHVFSVLSSFFLPNILTLNHLREGTLGGGLRWVGSGLTFF